MLRHAPIVVVSTLLACAPAARAEEPAWVLEVSERLLATAPYFETAAVDETGDAPAMSIAYRRLLARPEAVQVFERLLAAPRLAGRLYALTGLRHAAPDRFAASAAKVLAAVGDQEVDVFEACCLHRVPVAKVVPRIQGGEWDDLRDDDGEAPDAGARARELVDALIAGDDDAADDAAERLGTLGPVAVIPELPRALAHERPPVRARALRVAHLLSPWLGDLLAPVVKALSDPDEDARRNAAYALCRAANPVPAAEAAVLQVLRAKDADPLARAEVLAAAGELAMTDATFEAVVALLEHADADVREEARYALRQVVDEHPDRRLRERAAALVGE